MEQQTGHLLSFRDKKPILGDQVFLASGSHVIGDVIIGSHSSIWFGTVLRGDVNYIRVGEETNIQDLSVVHVTSGGHPTIIGNGVTVGHKAMLHACHIKDYALIGMGAIVLDGAEIGEESLVGAGSLVTQGSVFPPRSLIMGAPAKVKRTLSPKECNDLHASARHYCELAQAYT